MELFEKRLDSTVIFTGKVFTVRRDLVMLPNGHEATRELVEHRGGVGVLALGDDGQVLMVRQFRYGAGRVLLEIPAGKLEPGEQPLECGVRELREECGVVATCIEPLGIIVPTGAYCGEIIHLFLARGLEYSQPCLDEEEFLECERIPFRKALEMAADGRINDAKTIAALYRASKAIDKGGRLSYKRPY